MLCIGGHSTHLLTTRSGQNGINIVSSLFSWIQLGRIRGVSRDWGVESSNGKLQEEGFDAERVHISVKQSHNCASVRLSVASFVDALFLPARLLNPTYPHVGFANRSLRMSKLLPSLMIEERLAMSRNVVADRGRLHGARGDCCQTLR